MLDPHRLGVFQSVMVTGSVQEAADNLRMTPSAVSQHIAALQRQTGLDLFDRVGRGIVPTAAAEALIAQAETVLQQWHRLDDYVADLRDGRTGRLVLGYFRRLARRCCRASCARSRPSSRTSSSNSSSPRWALARRSRTSMSRWTTPRTHGVPGIARCR